MADKVRWKQRFENFEKARVKLQKTARAVVAEPEEELYQMALIRSFEFTFELGWKTLKDYLFHAGVNKVSLPREVIKQAFHHGIIEDGQSWIDMMESRNLMLHTYDEKKAAQAVEAIQSRFIASITQVYAYLKGQV